MPLVFDGYFHQTLTIHREASAKPSSGLLILYTRRIVEIAVFASTHFGYREHASDGERIVELGPPGLEAGLLLHPLGRAQREGQVPVKLVFDVEE